jgi:hypothetical protein
MIGQLPSTRLAIAVAWCEDWRGGTRVESCTMPASRSVVSVRLRELGDFSLRTQGRPPPAAVLAPAATRRSPGDRPHRPPTGARSIVDLDAVIADHADLPAVTEWLRSLGYHHEGDLGVPGREAFTSSASSPLHHGYVCASALRRSTVIWPSATPSSSSNGLPSGIHDRPAYLCYRSS